MRYWQDKNIVKIKIPSGAPILAIGEDKYKPVMWPVLEGDIWLAMEVLYASPKAITIAELIKHAKDVEERPYAVQKRFKGEIRPDMFGGKTKVDRDLIRDRMSVITRTYRLPISGTSSGFKWLMDEDEFSHEIAQLHSRANQIRERAHALDQARKLHLLADIDALHEYTDDNGQPIVPKGVVKFLNNEQRVRELVMKNALRLE